MLAPSTPDAQPVIVPEAVPQTVSVTPGQQPVLQPPLPQQPMLVPQTMEPSALANIAYQAARNEAAAHAQK